MAAFGRYRLYHAQYLCLNSCLRTFPKSFLPTSNPSASFPPKQLPSKQRPWNIRESSMWESRSSNIASSNHGSRLFFGCQNTWNKNPLVSRGFTSFNKKTRGIPKKAKEQSIDPKKTWPFWIIELKCVKQLELRHHKASQWWGGDEVISFFCVKIKLVI